MIRQDIVIEILKTIPAILNVVDTEYNILAVGGEITRTFENIDQVIGEKCYKIFQKRDNPCPWCKVDRVIKAGEIINEITTPDDPREKLIKKPLSVYLRPLKDKDGNIIGAIELGTDITQIRKAGEERKRAEVELEKLNLELEERVERRTAELVEAIKQLYLEIEERKRVEEALRDSEGKLNAMLQSVGDHMSMMDNDLNIIWANETAKRVFGNDIIGKKCYQAYHQRKEPCEPYPCLTLKAFQDGKAHGHDTQVTDKDGKIKYFQCTANVALRDKEGKPTAVMEISRDITERKQAEKSLQKAHKELERRVEERTAELVTANEQLERAIARANEMATKAEMANVAKSQFVAKMSHEIRTPMNGVIGMTGLLLDTELTPQQREYAETLRNSANSLLTLINDILDYSKIEAGKLDIEIMDFDLRRSVEDVMDTLTIEAHDKGLEFACLIQHDVPALVRGDPGRLRQILINFATNAIKFTEEGKVVIRATLEKEDDTHATVRFSVTDTGIGIPTESIDCLFEAFTQLDSSTTRRYGGAGLGLTISKQLTELMGGRIGVESQEGKGSTFWFTVVLEKQPEGHEAEIVVPKDIRGMRILVVDDNATTRHVLAEKMRSWGYRVGEASSGAQALDKLHQSVADGDSFSIAILQMVMRGMDGEALGQKIKEDPNLMGTILIMLTGVGKRGDAKRLKGIGFTAYLTGPVNHSQLYDCLATVTGRKTGAEERCLSSIVTKHSISEDLKRKIRILIVEDDVTNQKVALGILAKAGFRADVVANGKEAVKALETTPYDLVLMDLLMPDMDGFEATRVIRNWRFETENSKDQVSSVKRQASNIRIIAMTAHAMKGDEERCLEAGMNDYVSKPVEPQELIEAIEGQISGLAQATEPASTVKTASLEKQIFDRSLLLDRLGGDEELCNEVISGFVDDIPVQLEQLKQALNNDDAVLVEQQAHKIKGASANIGAQAMSDVAFEVEMAGKDLEPETANALVRKLEQEFERLRSALSDSGLTRIRHRRRTKKVPKP